MANKKNSETTNDSIVIRGKDYLDFENDAHYVKDISIENPNSPFVFFSNKKPEINVAISIDTKHIHESIYETTIRTEINAFVYNEHEGNHEHGENDNHSHQPQNLSGSKETVFIIDIKYSGLFNIPGLKPEEIKGNEVAERTLFVECPRILFPYLRSIVADLSIKSGFPPVTLNSINFEEMYQEGKGNIITKGGAK